MDPVAVVNEPPSIEYSPLMIETGTFASMPEIIISLDATRLDNAAAGRSVKENASGVVSGATVVTANVPDTPPTVKTACVAVENWFDAVNLTLTF